MVVLNDLGSIVRVSAADREPGDQADLTTIE
jgi:hypothetical protein